MVLITGRQLEHWHTGSMTRRASVLDHIEPEPVASVHPLDLDKAGREAGRDVTIESRRGKISLYARADDGMPRGAVFVPFCYYEAAANMLTNPVLDPFGKIPEFKYCAVKVSKGGPVPVHGKLRRRQGSRRAEEGVEERSGTRKPLTMALKTQQARATASRRRAWEADLFLGEVWVKRKGLAAFASANPSSFMVPGARNHLQAN